MNRRNFLQLISAEVALLGLAQKIQAQEWGHDQWDGFFVTILMEGAWDISLSTDPWLPALRPDEKDYFIEYRPDELIPWGHSAVGPAMKPMQAHFGDISIINGVFMSTNDNGHESLLSYALSGDALNQRGALGLEINATLPNTLFNVLTTNPIPTGERANRTTSLYAAQNSIQGQQQAFASTSINKAQSGILSKIREAQKDQLKLTTARKYLEDYKNKMGQDQNANFSSVVAASFKAGLSKTAIININNGNLDTHSGHPINLKL